MTQHKVVSEAEWTEARKQLLAEEKALTRARDRVNEARRALPWVRVAKTYAFDTIDGKRTLADLFEGRSQLIVQHFMFGPDWEAGCPGCSFAADHVDAAYQHLKHHDVTYVAVSRAPLAKLLAYRKRMGWRFNWVSSLDSDFNFDFHVSFTEKQIAQGKAYYNFEMTENEMDELPGESVFCKDADGAIYHTYSEYGRGGEEVLSAYMLLDLTPKGRNESGPMDWVRRRDEYEKEKRALT
ncbi:MAG TPA: thioredoxin family protein [Dongiaceae bacterium]